MEKLKVLIMGLPGSGKTTFASKLLHKLGDHKIASIWYNADLVRKFHDDWDFSLDGRLRQAQRMTDEADRCKELGIVAVCDFVCPTEYLRQRNNGYHARQEIDTIKNHWFQEDPLRLEPYGNKVFSQADEDGIIEEIFYRLGIYNGTFVEIGTENGLECNTHYLLHKNWIGYWFEGGEGYGNSIKTNFGQFMDKDKLRVVLGRLTKENINDTFNKASVSSHVDFLSIDVDGMDIHLFDALNIDAKVVCIEYNAKWPANIVRIPEYCPNYNWDGSDYMGSSLKALTEVANSCL